MITTRRKVETVSNWSGEMRVQRQHIVDISSKNCTTETEAYSIIIGKQAEDFIELDRKQMRDLFDILLTMRDRGEI